MNQTKLARWIELAEARSVCELAKADPGLFKLSAPPSATHWTVTKMVKTGFLGLSDRRCPIKLMRPAA
jgi:hypothetical protein